VPFAAAEEGEEGHNIVAADDGAHDEENSV
jgi:hypothetical protein